MRIIWPESFLYSKKLFFYLFSKDFVLQTVEQMLDLNQRTKNVVENNICTLKCWEEFKSSHRNNIFQTV